MVTTTKPADDLMEFVLEGPKPVRAEDLSSEQWVKIIEKMVRICTPQLRYLSGFKTLGQMINGHIHQLSYKTTGRGMLCLSPGLSMGTRLWDIFLIHRGSPREGNQNFVYQGNRLLPVVVDHRLLLSDKGSLIHWMDQYHIVVERKSQSSYGPPEVIHHQEAEVSAFGVVDSSHLEYLLTEFSRNRIGLPILSGLVDIVAKSCDQKRSSLNKLEEHLEELMGIIRRIGH